MSAVLKLVTDSGDPDMPALTRFEIWLRGSGFSPRTIHEALNVTRYLQEFAGCSVETVGALEISKFLGREHLAQSSRTTYFTNLWMFYKWYAQNGGHNPMINLRKPRAPKGTAHPVSDEQLRILLSAPLSDRTRLMILLAAFAGLRVHEIAKIRGQDVDLAGRTLHVVGKGGVVATLPLHPKLVEAAEAMSLPKRGWWFPSIVHPQNPILPVSVSRTVGRPMQRLHVPGRAHSLRHWYGTALVRSGADLRTAQTLLRHASLETTAIYVGVVDERRNEAVDRLDPFGGQ